MPLRAACPRCRTAYVLGDELRGKQVRCSRCERAFRADSEPAEELPIAIVEKPKTAAPAKPRQPEDRVHANAGRVGRTRRLDDAARPPTLRSPRARTEDIRKHPAGWVITLGAFVVSGIVGALAWPWLDTMIAPAQPAVEDDDAIELPLERIGAARVLRHKQAVNAVAFSPDGKILATGSHVTIIEGRDQHTIGKVKLWDVATARGIATLSGHDHWVACLAFSPDGRTLATGSPDSTVRLWDIPERREKWTLRGHVGEIFAVAFSRDGKSVVTACADNTVKIWDTATGQLDTTLRGHRSFVMSLALTADGRTFASGSVVDRGPGEIKLWNLQTRQETATMLGHRGGVFALAFTKDGKTLASGFGDGTVLLWDAPTRQQRATLKEHTGDVRALTFSADDKLLVTGSFDRSLKIWDVATQKVVATLRGHNHASVSIAISPDGKIIASAGADKTALLWELDKELQAEK